MRTEHYLFHVLGITSASLVKIVDSKEITFRPPTDRSNAAVYM